MTERHVACAARSGAITIAAVCPEGTIALAHAEDRRRLETAVCRASRRVRGNAVVVPGLRAETDDDHAMFLIWDFRDAVYEQLRQLRRGAA